MAKATKKSSKKSKKNSKTKVEQELKPAVPVDEGMVTIAISEADLATFTNLMTICAKTFEMLAIEAAEKDDAPSFKTLQARFHLSSAFALKLADCVKMPEPISRDMH